MRIYCVLVGPYICQLYSRIKLKSFKHTSKQTSLNSIQSHHGVGSDTPKIVLLLFFQPAKSSCSLQACSHGFCSLQGCQEINNVLDNINQGLGRHGLQTNGQLATCKLGCKQVICCVCNTKRGDGAVRNFSVTTCRWNAC
jgi:hypothetical protein